jgi:NtrC-family two-component system response regulator AlgB
VRVVAATNRDLGADVAAGRFREDLLYRLNVVEVTLPPLRARPADVLPLAKEFVAFFARTVRRPPPVLSPEAEHVLTAYAWPGNVRELRNVIEHAVMLWPDPVIEPRAFPERLHAASSATGAVALGGDVTLEALEREHMARVLARAASLDEAARILGINPSTLWRKRRTYGL